MARSEEVWFPVKRGEGQIQRGGGKKGKAAVPFCSSRKCLEKKVDQKKPKVKILRAALAPLSWRNANSVLRMHFFS